MKLKPHAQKWTISALVALALAASASLGLAANISYTFDTTAEGWTDHGAAGTVVWDGTHNRGGATGGCLKCTMVGGTDTEVDPIIDVAFDTSTAFSVEFDLMVDPASGTDTGGNYGNLQIADLDSAWAWHSEWYGSLGGSGGKFSTWQHVKIPFAGAYGPRAHLQFQLVTWSGPYSANVIIYIDNVVIQDTPPPTKAVVIDFAWPEQCVADSSWGAVSRTWSRDTTLHSDGSLKEVVDYGSGNTGWQEGTGEFHNFPAPYDLSKFTYVDFDLYLDAPTGLPSYGQYELASWYGWTDLAKVTLSADNIGKWTHYSAALPTSAGNCQGLVFRPDGNNLSGVFTYYIDNVTFWRPAEPPTIKALQKETSPAGAKITMDTAGNYQRDAICVPSGQSFFTWYGQTPVSYSFTITNFPDALAHPGFEAHLYIVNQDSIPGGNGTWNQTYGGCDWNAADILEFRVENAIAGGVIARIDWKTNLPGANPLTNAIYHPVVVNGPTAIGTWTLTFNDNTSATVTGPGITATNFTLPSEAAAQFDPNTYPNSFLQFGIFKNDGSGNGKNNFSSGTFSEIAMSGGLYPFDDTFGGPGLTANYAWRTSSSTAVQWVPPDTAWWLTWTTPDDGFGVQVSGNVDGTYNDAGVTYTYSSGATKVGAVPAATMPAGNSAFFRLKK
jgi:hypothetical protein